MERPLPCTTSRVAPWIDTAVALDLTASVVLLVKTPCRNDEEGICNATKGVLAIGVSPFALAYGISAIWGHSAVTACREANARPPDPPPRPVPPPVAPAGTSWIAQQAGPDGADVREAPTTTARLLVHISAGQPLTTGSDAQSGWRTVPLPDGRMGYVDDDDVEPIASPPP